MENPVIEQLFEKAVQLGVSQERLRIAQELLAIGSTGDNFEATWKEVWAVIDPGKD